ncbi:hypothetical protein MYX84_04405 [Acidobacteria bacterium AH-259-O06]|nr:hypothetical protein [Acidobacteria bacterium AH-259-O06]
MVWRKRSSRRRLRFIDKHQVRFAVEIGLYALLFPLVFLITSIAAHFSIWLIGVDAEIIHPLLRGFLGFCISHWWGVLLALGFVSYISVWFSHKIFGPLRRFENALAQKKKHPAEPVQCRLRGGDYFHEFAKLFEEFLNESRPVEGAGQIMEKKDISVDKANPPASNSTPDR